MWPFTSGKVKTKKQVLTLKKANRRIQKLNRNIQILHAKNEKLMVNQKIDTKTKLKMMGANRLKMKKYEARAIELAKLAKT